MNSKVAHTSPLSLLGIVSSMMVAVVTTAAPLTPGNIVVIDSIFLGHSLLEYQADGTLVQTVEIPYREFSAGGMTFDEQGLLWVYNGNSEATLSTWDAQADVWSHRTFEGWGSFVCFPCQGIGQIGNYVFATDEGAFGDPNGLVRFDRRDTNACVRFAAGRNYSALAVGLDGIVYARRADDVDPPPATVIDAFDPGTLALLKTVTLSERSLSIAADAQGQLFGASGQSILRFGPGGNLLDTHQMITNGTLYTLALSRDCRFVVVSSEGEVVTADSDFTPQDRFKILTGSQAYAAIVPPAPVPIRLTLEAFPVRLCWNSLTNQFYQVQFCSGLTANDWVDLGSPIQGNGTTNCIVDDITVSNRFYRLSLLPLGSYP